MSNTAHRFIISRRNSLQCLLSTAFVAALWCWTVAPGVSRADAAVEAASTPGAAHSHAGLLRYRTTWFGSTFPATGRFVKTRTHGDHAAWTDVRHVQNTVSALHVTPDGTVFCVGETEQGPEVALYRHGEPVGQFFIGHRSRARSVAADDEYVFIANVHTLSVAGRNRFGKPHHPPQGRQWSEVQRYSRATLMPDSFEGASGVYAETLVLEEGERPRAGALALHGDHLFVAETERNRVRVFDRHTLQPTGVREFACEGPQAIAADGEGVLWIIESAEDGRRSVARFGVDGVRRPHPITDINFPAALAVAPDGRLLVCDDGPAQQVLVYACSGDAAAPKRLAAVPMPTTLRGLSGIGADRTGTLYVGAEQAHPRWKSHNILGGVLAAFDPDWQRLWQLEGLVFCDIPGPVADPDSDRIAVYLPTEKLTLDLSAPAGSNWHFEGVTVDPFRFPDDPRLKHTWQSQSVRARVLDGVTYLFIHGMDARAMLQVYRIEGDTAVPHALFLANGNGTWPAPMPEAHAHSLQAPGTRDQEASVQAGIAPEPRTLNPPLAQPGGFAGGSPVKGELLWVDNNGNGQFDAGESERRSFPYDDPTKQGAETPRRWSVHIDEHGGVWQAHDTRASVSYFPAAFEDGRLSYRYGTARVWSVRTLDPRFNWPCNPWYDAESDRLLLLARNHPDGPGTGGGNRLVRFDGWLASEGKAAPAWVVDLPFDDAQAGRDRHRRTDISKTFAAAGEHIFVGANAGARSPIRVYRLSDGGLVGELGECHQLVPERFAAPGAGLGIIDGTDHLRAFRRADGEYLVFRGNNNHGSAVLYRWHPGRPTPYGPDGLRAQPRPDGEVVLSWTPPDDADAYRVERCTWTSERGWGAWDALATQHRAADFTDTAPEPNRRYRYRVQSANAHGIGGYSSTVQAQPAGLIGLDHWQVGDIGDTGENGSTVRDAAGILTLRGSGDAGIHGRPQAFHYAWRPMDGDGGLVVRLREQHATGRDARAGLMIRESLAPDARFVALATSPLHEVALTHSGDEQGGEVQVETAGRMPMRLPCRLKLTRTGDRFDAWAARDGEAWRPVGSVELALPDAARIGLFVTSARGEAVLAEARFELLAP